MNRFTIKKLTERNDLPVLDQFTLHLSHLVRLWVILLCVMIYWLFRFMIDHRYQQRGYGRAAMQTLIEILEAGRDCQTIKLSYEDENKAAERLYQALDFIEDGRINEHGDPISEGGEKVLRFDLCSHTKT